MRSCPRSQRTRWRAVARVLLTVLAFLGMQAAFARAAFPRPLQPTSNPVLRQTGSEHPVASVDAPRVPQRTNRRGANPLGPYVPSPAPMPDLLAPGAEAAPPASRATPPRFVPSPPFHPPRALGT